jgi:fatty-acyl-CoA synthase
MAVTTTAKDIEGRRQALRDAIPVWKPTTLHGRLDTCAGRFGRRPLVVGDRSTLTYRDVAYQSQCLAAGLGELGVEPGDRVGVVMANYP